MRMRRGRLPIDILLLLIIFALLWHAKRVHAAGRSASHILALGIHIRWTGLLIIAALRIETRPFRPVQSAVLSSNELSSAFLTKGTGTHRSIGLIRCHLCENA